MNKTGRSSNDPGTDAEIQLDALLRSYRAACPDMDGSANFMPELWAKIDSRRSSVSIFSRAARVLVTAALAASAILSIMISAQKAPSGPTQGAYMEALVTDGEASLNLLNPAFLTDMEQQ